MRLPTTASCGSLKTLDIALDIECDRAVGERMQQHGVARIREGQQVMARIAEPALLRRARRTGVAQKVPRCRTDAGALEEGFRCA